MTARRRIITIVTTVALTTVLLAGCGDDAGTTAADIGPADTTQTTAASGDTSASTAAPDPSGETYDFTIPAGTGAKLDAGESVDVLPELLEVQTGDLIRIDNQDERNHVVGPFFVPAADVMEHVFVTTGEFAGACSAHASGQITVVVT